MDEIRPRLDPPRYWKEFEQKVVGNKKVGTELYSTLGATTSGNLFILYAETETLTLMDAVSSIVGKMTGVNNQGGGGGAPMMAPPQQPGGPPGGRGEAAAKGVAL